MDVLKLFFFGSIGIFIYLASASGQSNENTKVVTESLDQFALKFLSETCDLAGQSLNLALSPYTVWNLMSIIAEGARGNTAKQIQSTIGIPVNGIEQFRKVFQFISNYLSENIQGVSLDISNAIFTTSSQNLSEDFQKISQNIYGVKVTPVDFDNSPAAAAVINQDMAKATGGRISTFVNENDVKDAKIFMTSALFFKGQWQVPFNKTATQDEAFYDEQGNQIGQVKMMYQSGQYPFSLILDEKALVVEIPYGNGDRLSMLVILPKKNENLSQVLKLLSNTSLSTVLNILERAAEIYKDDEVHVYLPKFKINSDLTLNVVLDKLGISDAFNEDKADLLGIFPHYLVLSRVIQKAEIEVDEEGTTASAISGASFQYKTRPTKFVANKPFAFIILDKKTRAIVFAGRVSDPKGI